MGQWEGEEGQRARCLPEEGICARLERWVKSDISKTKTSKKEQPYSIMQTCCAGETFKLGQTIDKGNVVRDPLERLPCLGKLTFESSRIKILGQGVSYLLTLQ